MEFRYTRAKHLALTLVAIVVLVAFGALYATSILRTQQSVRTTDMGWYSWGPEGEGRVCTLDVDLDLVLPLGVLSARYPVDAIIEINLSFDHSYHDYDRTFMLWYQHLQLDGVRSYNPDTDDWMYVDYKEGGGVMELRAQIVFPYEGPYAFTLVEKGNWSFFISKVDYDDEGRVLTIASVEAGAAQYFNNLIFGVGLASAGFAGVPLVSETVWKLVDERRRSRKKEGPTS